MLLIIAHHYVVNSGLSDVIFENPTSGRSLFLLLFGAWGKTGINCFVLITGYFMCTSQITAKKFLKLIFEIEFYNIIIYTSFILTGYEPFSIKSLFLTIVPFAKIEGFTNCYLVFFLFIPFLNILISHMNEKTHLRLILISVSILTIWGTIPKFYVPNNYVMWFPVLYFISSYIRLYPKKVFFDVKIWGIITLALLTISALSVIAMTYLSQYAGKTGFRYPYWFISDSNKIFAVVLSVSSFMFFKNLNLKYNRFINTVAASTFGVLMIHANSDAMRQWLWKDTFNNVGMYGSPYFILHAVGSVLTVYIVCTVIDYLRIYFLEKPFLRLYDRNYDRLSKIVYSIESKILNKINVSDA